MKTLIIPILLLTLSFPAFAQNDQGQNNNNKGQNNNNQGRVRGAPGPLLGAGLPVLLVGAGIYWIVRRRKNANDQRSSLLTISSSSLKLLGIYGGTLTSICASISK